jgi:hypothetical protein
MVASEGEHRPACEYGAWYARVHISTVNDRT